MTYRFIYDNADKHRIISAVMIDSRAGIPAIKNQIGSVVKTVIDSQIALVVDNCLFYKIETENGNLAGYLCLKIGANDQVTVLLFELRTSYEEYSSEISTQMSNFITSGEWKQDFLN